MAGCRQRRAWSMGKASPDTQIWSVYRVQVRDVTLVRPKQAPPQFSSVFDSIQKSSFITRDEPAIVEGHVPAQLQSLQVLLYQ